MRIHQWLKNIFVLVGVVFSSTWDDSAIITKAIFSFIAFCLISSSVYIFNDFIDLEADKAHPRKKYRPLASGLINLPTAIILMITLLILGLAIAANISTYEFIILLTYIALNICYSLYLKYVVIVDLIAITFGFMLRIFSGTIAIGIIPSYWLLVCSMALVLFLVLVKRRAESKVAPSQILTRKTLKVYNIRLTDKLIDYLAFCSVILYSLYSIDNNTIHYHATNNLPLTIPFMAFAMFRYRHLIYNNGAGEDTAKDVFYDLPMLISITLFTTLLLIILNSPR